MSLMLAFAFAKKNGDPRFAFGSVARRLILGSFFSSCFNIFSMVACEVRLTGTPAQRSKHRPADTAGNKRRPPNTFEMLLEHRLLVSISPLHASIPDCRGTTVQRFVFSPLTCSPRAPLRPLPVFQGPPSVLLNTRAFNSARADFIYMARRIAFLFLANPPSRVPVFFVCVFLVVGVGVFLRGRNDELDMRGMDEDDLMTLCALSGCDYLPSVHGIGLKKAHRLVSRHKEVRTFYHTIYHIVPYNLYPYHIIPCHIYHTRYYILPYIMHLIIQYHTNI